MTHAWKFVLLILLAASCEALHCHARNNGTDYAAAILPLAETKFNISTGSSPSALPPIVVASSIAGGVNITSTMQCYAFVSTAVDLFGRNAVRNAAGSAVCTAIAMSTYLSVGLNSSQLTALCAVPISQAQVYTTCQLASAYCDPVFGAPNPDVDGTRCPRGIMALLGVAYDRTCGNDTYTYVPQAFAAAMQDSITSVKYSGVSEFYAYAQTIVGLLLPNATVDTSGVGVSIASSACSSPVPGRLHVHLMSRASPIDNAVLQLSLIGRYVSCADLLLLVCTYTNETVLRTIHAQLDTLSPRAAMLYVNTSFISTMDADMAIITMARTFFVHAGLWGHPSLHGRPTWPSGMSIVSGIMSNATVRSTNTTLLSRLGYLINSGQDYRAAVAEPDGDAILGSATVPSAYDASVAVSGCADVILAIRDQQSCGACWAFSSSHALEIQTCVSYVTAGASAFSIQLSPQFLMSCGACCGNDVPGPPDPCSGGQLQSAWDFIGAIGTTSADCYPYLVEAGPCATTSDSTYNCAPGSGVLQSPALLYTTGAVGQYLGSTSAMQQAILQMGAVTTGFQVYENFYNYGGGVYQSTEGSAYVGGHAIVIIGWGVSSGTPYWICVNSWGPAFGLNGLFWILRGQDFLSIESMSWTAGSEIYPPHTQTVIVQPTSSPVPPTPTTNPQTPSAAPRGAALAKAVVSLVGLVTVILSVMH